MDNVLRVVAFMTGSLYIALVISEVAAVNDATRVSKAEGAVYVVVSTVYENIWRGCFHPLRSAIF